MQYDMLIIKFNIIYYCIIQIKKLIKLKNY